MDKKKTALFGGSFDPIHLGHLFILHCAITKTDYERFVIMPAYMSNFKRDTVLSANPAQRLAMIKLAVEEYYRIYPNDRKVEFTVSDYELEKGGVSYTYDTVCYLLEKYEIETLGLLIGDDHIERLNQWYKFDELKEKVNFLICPRENSEEAWKKLPDGIRFTNISTGETSKASATRIRTDLELFRTDLSDNVEKYVRENNLYN